MFLPNVQIDNVFDALFFSTGDRLSNFEVRVGYSSETINENDLCLLHASAVSQGATKYLSCLSPTFGRYVSIQLLGIKNTYLTLCEVRVYHNTQSLQHGIVLSFGKIKIKHKS